MFLFTIEQLIVKIDIIKTEIDVIDDIITIIITINIINTKLIKDIILYPFIDHK